MVTVFPFVYDSKVVIKDYGMKTPIKLICNCPDREQGQFQGKPPCSYNEKERCDMSGYLMEILLALENLDEKELEYVNVWTEYTLQKKEALSAQIPSEQKL
jgi:hypothetical protein